MFNFTELDTLSFLNGKIKIVGTVVRFFIYTTESYLEYDFYI